MNEAPDLLLQLYGAVVAGVRAALLVAVFPVPLAAVVGGALAVPALHVREGHPAPAYCAEKHAARKLPSPAAPLVVAGVGAHFLPRAVHQLPRYAVTLVEGHGHADPLVLWLELGALLLGILLAVRPHLRDVAAGDAFSVKPPDTVMLAGVGLGGNLLRH